MRVAEIRALYEYDAWANARLLAGAVGLDDGAFVALTRFPRGSLRDTFLHIVNAGRFHRGQWASGEPLPPFDRASYPTVAALAALVAQETTATRAFIATLTDADLARSRTICFGGEYPDETAPLWLLMMHTLLHNTQHRGEIAQILTELGRSPGDLDLMDSLSAIRRA